MSGHLMMIQGSSIAPEIIVRFTVAETFGATANVWLFGSRVDDNNLLFGKP